MNRRKFIGNTALLTGASMLTYCTTEAKSEGKKATVIKPMGLKKGDTIGLITPGSALIGDAELRAVRNMESLGFKVVKSKNFNIRTGFVAGTDQQRVDDLHAMFANPEINAIICARGGYGTGRLLQLLDYELIRNNPKILLGFSDITALHYAIFQQTGLVCYHGPVASSEFTPHTTFGVQDVLMSTKLAKIARPVAWQTKSAESYQYMSLVKGVSEGQLIGGNLSIMCSLLGTPYDVDFVGKIVFIEEVGESLYRVDRMLTQLLNSGKLDNCAGVVLGIFDSCTAKSGGVDDDNYVTLTKVLKDRLGRLAIPVMYGLPIGHIDDNSTLPIGIRARMDTDRQTLELLETAVV
ncbi:LD-carboxypeptidase [Reichenbachiella agarivorans]|uniref:LD-carboxypeptidase n=1 Tax=Reichenbachiella agarivorans TaxID=2979464 RepID=A0ABY6CLN7_9BACT|nr:LD-carboxypeptidase [Reichenbachiella agarivorans]UXP31294.1 LD-carboxypeptidase [Reichenbachiella agarivorans]